MSVVDWFRDPEHRVSAAWVILWFTMAAWPLTHILMVLLDPPENSWVFHVLLAISWFAIWLTALNIIVTTDVRKVQENDES